MCCFVRHRERNDDVGITKINKEEREGKDKRKTKAIKKIWEKRRGRIEEGEKKEDGKKEE